MVRAPVPFWPVCLLLAQVLVLAGCAGNSAPVAATPPPLDITVVRVQQKDVPIYGNWVATLDGYINANIQPQVSGYLIKQTYSEGSFVHQNDVLFEIDPRPFQAILDQARGQVAQAKGQLAQSEAHLALSKINVQRDTPLAKARAIAQSQRRTSRAESWLHQGPVPGRWHRGHRHHANRQPGRRFYSAHHRFPGRSHQ